MHQEIDRIVLVDLIVSVKVAILIQRIRLREEGRHQDVDGIVFVDAILSVGVTDDVDNANVPTRITSFIAVVIENVIRLCSCNAANRTNMPVLRIVFLPRCFVTMGDTTGISASIAGHVASIVISMICYVLLVPTNRALMPVL